MIDMEHAPLQHYVLFLLRFPRIPIHALLQTAPPLLLTLLFGSVDINNMAYKILVTLTSLSSATSEMPSLNL